MKSGYTLKQQLDRNFITKAQYKKLKRIEEDSNKREQEYMERRRKDPFYNWFCTFLEEKEIDLSIFLTEDIQVGDICQAIVDTTEKERTDIKNMLVKIDFQNGNVYDFFKYLATIKENTNE